MSTQERTLRDAIAKQAVRPENKAAGKKASVFCVTSGKGGVGKTCFSVNFALALAKCGRKAIIIDGDFGFSNVNIMLGKNAKYTLEHIVRGEKRLEDVMEECYPNVWYISGGSGVSELVKIRDDQMEKILKQLDILEKEMDYIIFDTGAGMNDNIMKMIHASDQAILITTPEPTSILDSYVVLKTASEEMPVDNVAAVINKAASEKEAVETFNNFSSVVHKYLKCEVNMLGFIPFDSRVPQAITAMVPYIVKYPGSSAAAQFQKIANRITNFEPEQEAGGLKKFLLRLVKGIGRHHAR